MAKCSFAMMKPTEKDDQKNLSTNAQPKRSVIELTKVLDDYLVEISKTGQTLYPWKVVKPVFLVKLDRVMRTYNNRQSFNDVPTPPNCRLETFDQIYSTVMDAADTFTEAPFTVQRLCELLCYPDQHYKRIDKFLRALEKNILVVTTVDERGSKLSAASDDVPIINTSHTVKLTPLFEWLNKPLSGVQVATTPSSSSSQITENSTEDVDLLQEKDSRSCEQDNTENSDQVNVETLEQVNSQKPEEHVVMKSSKRPYGSDDDDSVEIDVLNCKRAKTEYDVTTSDTLTQDSSCSTEGEAAELIGSSSNEDTVTDCESLEDLNSDNQAEHHLTEQVETGGEQAESGGEQAEVGGEHVERSGEQVEAGGKQAETGGEQVERSGEQLEAAGEQVERSGEQTELANAIQTKTEA